MQQITYDQSVYEDVNGEKWVKYDDCMSPFHLKCCISESEQAVHKQMIYLHFFQLQQELGIVYFFG